MSRLETFTSNNNVFLLFPCGTVKEYPNQIMPSGTKENGSRPYGFFQLNPNIPTGEWVKRARQVLHVTKSIYPQAMLSAVRKIS